ncbi:cytochrome c-type biogenesis protein [Kozakia baliensis]|uniref:cytochrome c-type biogenesis protein n=1 Tax=Kozakia baliensis TaxID=153496 RepID=UPI00345BC495
MKRAPALALGLVLIATPAFAVDNPSEMLPNKQQEQRAEAIGAQLRCLVCQNESIEDSSADLARDLRHVVREHVAKGESDRQIMAWMTARYGEFVRLKPRLSVGTVMLWAMPVLALLAGLAAAATMLRRRHEAPPLSEEERRRVAELSNATGQD